MKVLAADIGGTFTDLALYEPETNRIRVLKVHSTPSDFSLGVISGIKELKADLTEIDSFIHGTTAATNAVIERNGAGCGLITTKGFRDVLEIRRRARPHQYSLAGQLNPLIPRSLRLEVNERTESSGAILVDVDEEEVRARAEELLQHGVEAVVVSFLNSYANPQNEERAKAVLAKVWPNEFIVVASDLLREFREFERTSTAACNAYVQPVVSNYLRALKTALKEQGYSHDLLIVQSNGGVLSSDLAAKFPVNTLLSGPAAGVIATKYIGEITGNRNVISCDMGGTSFDVSLIDDGRPLYTSEVEIDFGIPVKVPQSDIITIGAGGGSIALIDGAGMLQVGPKSAGADPGPACYKMGGRQPTVTDANLVLGRLNPILPYGAEGTFQLDLEAAKAAIQEKIAGPLGYDIYQAALGIVRLCNTNMSGAIRSVSVARGFDPRDFSLVAFGGAGPMHINALLRETGVPKAIIPYNPGVLCAIGCLSADFRRDFVQTVNRPLHDIGIEGISDILSVYEDKGKDDLIASEVFFTDTVNVYELEMQYEGQLHTIRVSFETLPVSEKIILEEFEQAYARRFKYNMPGMGVRVVNIRCSTIGIRPKLDLKVDSSDSEHSQSQQNALKVVKPVFFDGEFLDTPVYDRSKLHTGETITGPALIEQRDSTTVLEPGTKIEIDEYHNMIMETV